MPLVLARIDCRLIHGQVVETWVPHTCADSLIVANDDLAGNPFLRSVMELAVPPAIRVRFCRLDEAIPSSPMPTGTGSAPSCWSPARRTRSRSGRRGRRSTS